MTSVKASQLFNVPKSTIRTHVGKPSLHIGAGQSFYLTKKQDFGTS